ncbi:MAG: hotdog domain-containing protein [Candidatus Pelagadaptatus aseana]|uniref:acyl-CoA thioesterase n=1 Tax=Candidatus Pelagadaptatus aseana TaxID=3120508 RepID=UPI0039B2355F
MNYYTRQIVKPDDLNAANALFGGRLLSWIDEEAAIFAICQLDYKRLVTAHMSTVDFESSAFQGDIVEIGCEVVKVGRTSLTVRCNARNKSTRKSILTVDEIVFVCLDEQAKPYPHGKTLETLTPQ